MLWSSKESVEHVPINQNEFLKTKNLSIEEKQIKNEKLHIDRWSEKDH